MATEETAEEIDIAAAAWAARADDGALSPVDQDSLDHWLAGDTRRLGAYARARAVAVHSRRAAALNTGVEAPLLEDPQPSRRAMLAAGFGAVSLVSAGLAAAYLRRSQTFETARGELRVLALADGSSISLSTLSRVSVRYGSATRRIMLMFGEALFDVAADPSRPFVIESAGAVLTATSGRFLLRRFDQSELQVSALTGEARILWRSQDEHLIRANEALSITPETVSAVEVMEPAEAVRRVAWTQGNLAFHDDPLGKAAQEFDRYQGAPIQIADPEVAGMKITGLFEANDPAAFARAVAMSLNLSAEISPNRIVLSRS